MGLFIKNEDELQKINEKKKIDFLKKLINKSTITDLNKSSINEYLDNILRNSKKNDFFEMDFLLRVLTECVADNLDMCEIKKIIKSLKIIFPMGEKTDNYEMVKECFINNFIGKNGYIYREIFDEVFYSLFDSITDYVEVMNLICGSNKENHFDIISSYATKVIRYMTDSDNYKKSIISFIGGMNDVVDNDYESYLRESITDALKRIGVYSVDEKQIALINANMEKIEAYMDSFEYFKNEVDRSKNEINSLINEGKEKISNASKLSILELTKEIEKTKEAIIKKLDERMLELEMELKNKSDATFNDILVEYQKKIREFRLMFQGYSKATSDDLRRIQKAAEESVVRLQDAVNNDENLQGLLTKANEDNKLRETLITLMEKESELKEKTIGEEIISQKVVIPGNERIILPASPAIIIPDEKEISRVLIRAFDEKIPFEIRMQEILNRKEENERNGLFYHEKTEQIIRDLIEGDWPYLWGPSGCGKSFLMKQIADLLQIKLVKNGKITEPYTVMGYNDPQGHFRATQTYLALLYGYLLGFDEFDNGNQDTIVTINEIYSSLLEAIDNPNEKVYVTFAEDVLAAVNPNFRMISAGNTSGEGENYQFSSRGKVDESVLERMTPIFINYDNRVEEKIFGSYKEWYDFFVKFRLACDEYAKRERLDTAPGIGTTRDAQSITKYVSHNSKSLSQVITEKFIQTKNQEYLEIIGRFIAKAYGINYDEEMEKEETRVSLDKIKVKKIAREFVYQCKNGVK